jgi:polygalacturonase
MLRNPIFHSSRVLVCLFSLCLILFAPRARAQDTRTVSEPVFPAVCTTLTAELQQTGNVLPSADESSFDTTRVQAALNTCVSGEAVELAEDGASGDNAFLIQPITIPSGVTLLVDAGVTVYGSRNPADYAVASGSCGIVAASSQGCNALITIDSSNAGIMGYGVIDGRGGQTLTGGANAGTTWWQLAYQAQQQNENQYNPQLVKIDGSNITLYKITLQNSPMFHVTYEGSGFTAWDVKVIAPGDARNTDGIDPGPAQNVTIENSYIGDGDDNISLKPSENPGGGAAADMTILNNNFYVGHGMSIGSQTAGGASNVLVENLNIDGDPTNSNDTGIRIKSESSNGGIVSNVTYENVCMQNVASPIQFNPFYDSSTGSNYPQFENITLSNVTVLTAGNVLLEGYSSTYPLGLTLDNVNFSAITASDVSAENANVTIGPGPANFSSDITGTNVTVTNNVSNPSEAQYSCPSSAFPLLAPEFFGSAAQAAPGQALTLTAIFEPVREPNWESSTAGQYASTTAYNPVQPTGTVTFYDGSNQVGQVTLTGSNDLASITLSSETVGTHSYTAVYSGDSNYAGVTTAAFAVTVASVSTTTALSASATTINAGQPVTFTATVTSSGGTPAGTVNFADGGTTLGTVTLNGGVASYTATSLAAGSHSITASFAGSGNFTASVSTPVTIEVQNFAISASTTSLSIPPGSSASTTLTFTGAGGLTGAISVACSGLPVYVTCSFNPASTTLSGNTASTVLTVSVAPTLNGWLLPVLPLLAFAPRSRKRRRRYAMLAAIIAAVGLAWMAGCGSGGAAGSSSTQAPPAGQQTVLVTATAATAAGTLTNTTQITLNVQ